MTAPKDTSVLCFMFGLLRLAFNSALIFCRCRWITYCNNNWWWPTMTTMDHCHDGPQPQWTTMTDNDWWQRQIPATLSRGSYPDPLSTSANFKVGSACSSSFCSSSAFLAQQPSKLALFVLALSIPPRWHCTFQSQHVALMGNQKQLRTVIGSQEVQGQGFFVWQKVTGHCMWPPRLWFVPTT